MNELNFVLSRIVDMDKRADDVKSETENQLELIEQSAFEKIRNLEAELDETTKKNLDRFRSEIMEEAETKANQILSESNAYCENIKNSYEKLKLELVKRITDSIIAGRW
ncbi:hypothetical protein [Alkalibacter mobilis]|uniref:hypothetical protein n=1 Tax=Alkalibacter mobilis TaxID=2787712 RepID=UPI00189C5BA6|nr:hypothetical protein [Alkalibacter mobilis]MBF7096553.1 hypothetical protein [Alkalibacter mobilis]